MGACGSGLNCKCAAVIGVVDMTKGFELFGAVVGVRGDQAARGHPGCKFVVGNELPTNVAS